MTSRWVYPLLGLLVCSAANPQAGQAAAAAPPAYQLFPDPVVARGKGFTVRQSEVDEAVAGLKATLSTQGQAIPDSQRPEVAARMLDRIILTRILEQKATPEDSAKAKTLADKFIADAKNRAPNEESYRRQLLAVGIKPEMFEKRALEQATVESVLEREVKSKLTVSDRELRDFYERGVDVPARELQETIAKLESSGKDTVFYTDATKKLQELTQANLSRMDKPERVRASHILIYTIDKVTREALPSDLLRARRELMDQIVARLKAGEDFKKVAREVSEDPEVLQTGGEYVVARDATMAPELKAALFSLPENRLSDPIQTKYGLHVALVHERIAAGKVLFEKAEEDIRQYLLNQGVQKRFPAYFEELKRDYGVVLETGADAR
ncbi:MAG: hypothetical protein FJ387_23325 [Verrucomicrobia bacterium]|nr:hypothetical protein [Verrucomicrobiota bacterium]